MRSKADGIGQLNLAHGPETKNNEKIKIKNRVAQKKRCRQKSVEAVREEEVKLYGGRGVGLVKEVGFKPGVKERWSYRCTKWWSLQLLKRKPLERTRRCLSELTDVRPCGWISRCRPHRGAGAVTLPLPGMQRAPSVTTTANCRTSAASQATQLIDSLITGPPTHSVGGQYCFALCRLSSSVTHHGRPMQAASPDKRRPGDDIMPSPV